MDTGSLHKTSPTHALPLLCLALAICSAGQSHAIGMRHDVPGEPASSQTPFIDHAASYDAVAQLTVGGTGAIGSGTLVAPDRILTSAHILDADRDGNADFSLAQLSALFGANVASSPDFILNGITAIDISPGWVANGTSQFDLAVITLGSPFTAIDPLPITADSAIGIVGTTSGYGSFGFGNSTFTAGDGQRRAADNMIDVLLDDEFEGWTLQIDFDRSDGGTSTFGSSNPLALEGAAASGDSGGPLVGHFSSGGSALVGVQATGYNPFGGDFEYGDISIYTPVADPANIAFLEANGVIFSAPPVPEPSALAFIALFASISSFVRRRPAKRAI